MHNILVAPFGGMVDALLKGPLEVRDRFGATPEPHLGAQVVAASLARPAVVAWHAHLEGNAVANLVASDIVADGHYNPGRLVA